MLKGKRILLTGLTGQLGEGLATGLAPYNEIWGLARYSAPGSREKVEALGIVPVTCDYVSNDFTGVPDDFDLVIHAAANCRPATAEQGFLDNARGSGFLFNHLRRSRAFVHVSTTGVYKDQPDPGYRYVEGDQLGGMSAPGAHYGVSKVATEAVVRTLATLYSVPTTILRMNVAYGKSGNGGFPGWQLEQMLAGEAIRLPPSDPCNMVPIHEDDLVEQIEGAAAAARTEATVLNWGGDEMVSTEQWVRYMGELTGITPVFSREPAPLGQTHWSRAADSARRDALVGRCAVPWREGFRRMIAERHPELAIAA